jgi:hypothetical protein
LVLVDRVAQLQQDLLLLDLMAETLQYQDLHHLQLLLLLAGAVAVVKVQMDLDLPVVLAVVQVMVEQLIL